MSEFDVIVLGAGPGGYLAAERAGQAGLSVLLIEKQYIGGVCLNEGCIPTKTLLHAARIYHAGGNSRSIGVRSEKMSISQTAVLQRKRVVTAALVSGVKAGLRAAKVKTAEGTGLLRGKDERGFLVEVGGELHIGRNLILATGSRPILPGIEGLRAAQESGFALTSTETLELRERPAKLCVIGGGVIGLEMASYFAMCGTEVMVVEAQAAIGGGLDRDAAELVKKGCEKLGIRFWLESRAVRVCAEEKTVAVSGKDGEETLSCDRVLICIGRRANTEGFGLESLHVPTDERGVLVDECARTGVPGVYAVGDCTGRNMLAHVAFRQAESAVNAILGKTDPINWHCVPGLVHTEPEAAFVGMSPEEAAAAGYDTVVSKLSMNYSGLYLAETVDGTGIIKLVFDRKTKTMLGALIVGGPASELITLCAVFIETRMPTEGIKRLVFPHPTYGEAIREAICAAGL